jgi:hypothetical protein
MLPLLPPVQFLVNNAPQAAKKPHKKLASREVFGIGVQQPVTVGWRQAQAIMRACKNFFFKERMAPTRLASKICVGDGAALFTDYARIMRKAFDSPHGSISDNFRAHRCCRNCINCTL